MPVSYQKDDGRNRAGWTWKAQDRLEGRKEGGSETPYGSQRSVASKVLVGRDRGRQQEWDKENIGPLVGEERGEGSRAHAGIGHMQAPYGSRRSGASTSL